MTTDNISMISTQRSRTIQRSCLLAHHSKDETFLASICGVLVGQENQQSYGMVLFMLESG